MDFWLNLKKKVAVLLERDPRHLRLIAWRDRVTKVLLFLDNHFIRAISAVFLSLVLFGVLYFFAFRSPKPFPEQALITIERGESLSQIANSFEEKKGVRSGLWLKTFIFILGGEKRVIAGDYYFPDATNIFKVAKMIHNGEFGLIAQKITIPEGTSSIEIGKILEKELPTFNTKDFVAEVSDNNYEGYLFPDTYFLMPNTKASDLILMMRENFARQIKTYEEDVLKFQKPLNEVVTMASIIEDEANGTLESKRIVSGILWKRLRLEMPLQVDAPFQYYNGKNSYTLTKEDLAEDHKYNTYKNKGLPPTAITNPGIDSIRAAITPTKTNYLYFLSDKSGNMYYAKNFDEHKRNRELYLN
ncbi:MAG: hypothetical protein A3A96_00375 [Candidatus Zambryskibacteria bacterium RIFCSPLOWO2_01_FULL_39_39]|uniref:Endolytic murein transglycosylase n=1 Tax=Candidatus Zambryskibacteria bacterium RIFCSPLOWO2_01_FULL_39_39 TaxID=1802758 RepID=A0A1G2TX52_9BACT|nr:MAG: Aminodeoxychorismate lyase [Parcubacteria group bacterium GW2011_GWA1_38_7]OHA87837.1 MAG: hypothetical protein A2644_01520 [Candidatus Zambryskibacteria bacterium RIFCSPHIGHO2_01_FULL_39_63]OHA94939.1 MAG: hypothetical protein A3B88_00995 [Candidatus Zambryskibacteria bacterium RIFCSPHIGHO2_02_FULL_39_19]OHA99119.1 MAG: hypothetical protein A3F20_02945 [Candidatus Zambryskibacteria bacterium RIFCSPHIGHO2_12_FULL_39_21]OHB01881.1 MAG: hypothetical protein A3A96_00375 [Candidatus Zambrys